MGKIFNKSGSGNDAKVKSEKSDSNDSFDVGDAAVFIVSMMLLLVVSIIDGIMRGIGKVFDLLDESDDFNW